MPENTQDILLVPHNLLLGGGLFDASSPFNRKEIAIPFYRLRETLRPLGYDLKTIDQSKDISSAHSIIFFEMPSQKNRFYRACLEKNLQDKMYLLALEPHSVHPPNHNPAIHANFRRVLTWNEDLVDNKKYLKIYYTLPISLGERISLPRPVFQEKKLLCLISSNKWSSYGKQLYSERIKAIRFMERRHPEDFDLYGLHWETPIIHNGMAQNLKINAAIQKFWPKSIRIRQFPSYRSAVSDKSRVLPGYKFTLAYENELDGNGYVSEKILEAFLYGCVPVYLGDPNIAKVIPKDCFIDKREYPAYESLYARLSGISEQDHMEYMDNMERFLNSDKMYPFTIDNFIKTIRHAIGI